jgi:outer membrane murein-binding lipoprotein Lpp
VSATLASWLIETVEAEREQVEDVQSAVQRLEAKIDQLSAEQKNGSGSD